MFTFFLRITQGSDALWHRGNFTGDIPVIIQLVICSQKLVIAQQYIIPVIIHLDLRWRILEFISQNFNKKSLYNKINVISL
jgi:hypothetical protein